MEITGGSFSTNGSLSADVVGNFQSGTLTVSGGSFIGASAGTVLGLNSSGGTSTLTVSGAGSVTASTLQLSAATVVVNLDGGTLTANQIVDVDHSGATGLSNTTFNFNSGTLIAGAASTTFMTGLTKAYVKSGGAKIDTNGKDITIGTGTAGWNRRWRTHQVRHGHTHAHRREHLHRWHHGELRNSRTLRFQRRHWPHPRRAHRECRSGSEPHE